ncbi:replicative DNA helicase [Bacillus songklensis]|uniref:Replicative DNA helicase n=1 Tax=Bacillus songklensis TaxID=1069116 RepID=A0ABV8B0K9_9BACI
MQQTLETKYSIEAECTLLGSIFLEPAILQEISLKPEHFYDPRNSQIFKWMLQLIEKKKPIDFVAMVEIAGNEKIENVGGVTYLMKLTNAVPSTANYEYYADVIMKMWKQRAIQNILKSFEEGMPSDEIDIQGIIQQLNRIDVTGTRERFDLTSRLANLYELPDIPVPVGLSGIPTGYKDLDDMTDGWQDEDSIIIGARPSMGKTAFLLNLAANAGLKGAIPVIFSLEMSADSLIKRMLSMLGGIDGNKMKNPYHYFNDDDRTRWVQAIGLLSKVNPQIFDKPGQTVNEMRAQVRQVKKDFPGRKLLILIDYLTLIRPQHDHSGNAHLQVSEISAALKAMAKEFKNPVITLAQLSRGVESRANKRPMMSDLRESGSIEQDADIIAFLYRDEYYNKDSDKKNILEIDIAKQRNGPTGVVELLYLKEQNKILDLSRKNVMNVKGDRNGNSTSSS